MKVILLKQVPKVGKKDEIVEVANGFAENSLFPRKLAIPATASAIDSLKRGIQNKSAEKEIRIKLLDDTLKNINGNGFTMSCKANKEGGLFSKIHSSDIAISLEKDHRIIIDQSCISIPGDTIKTLGTYTIVIKDDHYTGTFNLEVVGE